VSTLNNIKKLVKKANYYDTIGDHKSADKVDSLIISAFNKLGEDKVSGIITAEDTKVEGNANQPLATAKTGIPGVDSIFEGTEAPSGTSPQNLNIGNRVSQNDLKGGTKSGLSQNPISNKTSPPGITPKQKEVAKKINEKGETMTDAEIDSALEELEGITSADIEKVLEKPEFLKRFEEGKTKATPKAEAPRNNLDTIKGKSIGWATVNDITLSGDRVTSVNLTLKGGKKVKYTPKTKTRDGKSALSLTVGDINKKLQKQLKV